MFALIAIVVLLAAAFFCVYRAGQYSVDVEEYRMGGHIDGYSNGYAAAKHEANVSGWEDEFATGVEFATENYAWCVAHTDNYAWCVAHTDNYRDESYGYEAGVAYALRNAEYLGLI